MRLNRVLGAQKRAVAGRHADPAHGHVHVHGSTWVSKKTVQKVRGCPKRLSKNWQLCPKEQQLDFLDTHFKVIQSDPDGDLGPVRG